MAVVHRFSEMVNAIQNDSRLEGKKLVYYTGRKPHHVANTVFLMASYLVLYRKCTPAEAMREFTEARCLHLLDFQDASYLDSDFNLSITDCLKGLLEGMRQGWYSRSRFDAIQFTECDAEGDFSEVVPDKFIAFRGPGAENTLLRAEEYAEIFVQRGVKAVVRLNEPDSYDKRAFTNRGIAFYDLYFDDCSSPSAETVRSFFDICDKHTDGIIAVHCFAGLGRTGTLIALWMMRYHHFKARPAIAWLRLMRPGSVIGEQQHYLERCEGCAYGTDNTIILDQPEKSGKEEAEEVRDRSGIMSKVRGKIARHFGQATLKRREGMLAAKSMPSLWHDFVQRPKSISNKL